MPRRKGTKAKGGSRRKKTPIDVTDDGPLRDLPDVPSAETEATAIGPALDPEQVHQVFLWITLGATEFQIAESIADRWPDADNRLLMAAAFQQIANTGLMDRSLIRGWVIEAAREQYRRAVLVNDAAAAIASLRIVTMTARL